MRTTRPRRGAGRIIQVMSNHLKEDIVLKRVINFCIVLWFATLATSLVHAKELPTAPIYKSEAILVPAGMTVEDVK